MLSTNSTEKSPIFTNTPCKSTCLYNAPSMRTLQKRLQTEACPSTVLRSFAEPIGTKTLLWSEEAFWPGGNPPVKIHPKYKSSSEQVFLNTFCWVPDSSFQREAGKSSRKLFKKVRVSAVFFGISGFWVGFWASIIVRKTQEGCGGLGAENPAAFLKAGPIFQQPFDLPESAQTLAGIAFCAAGNRGIIFQQCRNLPENLSSKEFRTATVFSSFCKVFHNFGPLFCGPKQSP